MTCTPAAHALLAALAVGGVALPSAPALAWGATGHRIISRLGVETLPQGLPAFLRRPETVAQVGELGREPDRSRGAGQPHDGDLDPGHFFDIDDTDHSIGGVPVSALPASRADFQIAVAKGGGDPGKAGYLPYNLLDGYEQLVKDFAYWRVETAAARATAKPQERVWYAADLNLREAIIIRDLGYWSHFVGDASMPLHVSVHYNAWGSGPNPNHYTDAKIHGPFEGDFVRANVTPEGVRAAMTPYKPCTTTMQACVVAYMETSRTYVEPLFRMWTDGAFARADPRARAFATTRVAAGASALRDMVADAWRASAAGSAGHPSVAVADAEAGKPVPFEAIYGDD